MGLPSAHKNYYTSSSIQNNGASATYLMYTDTNQDPLRVSCFNVFFCDKYQQNVSDIIFFYEQYVPAHPRAGIHMEFSALVQNIGIPSIIRQSKSA